MEGSFSLLFSLLLLEEGVGLGEGVGVGESVGVGEGVGSSAPVRLTV